MLKKMRNLSITMRKKRKEKKKQKLRGIKNEHKEVLGVRMKEEQTDRH